MKSSSLFRVIYIRFTPPAALLAHNRGSHASKLSSVLTLRPQVTYDDERGIVGCTILLYAQRNKSWCPTRIAQGEKNPTVFRTEILASIFLVDTRTRF